MNKKDRNNPILLIVVLLAAAAAAVILGASLLSDAYYKEVYLETDECFNITSENESAILLNGDLLEEKAVYENDTVFLPWDMAVTFPGNALYYEASSGTLYLTTQHETKTWREGDGLLVRDGKIYVDSDIVSNYTDADIHIYSDPERAVIRTDWTDIVTARAAEDTYMRCEPEKRKAVVSDIPAGTLLYCTGTEDNGWSLVYADNGYFGYVETGKMTINEPQDFPHETNSLTTFDKILMDKTIKMVWHYVDVQENNDILDYMLEEAGDSINLICPTWITIENKEGDISCFADAEYVRNIRERNMNIWTMVSDYHGSDSSTGEILMDPQLRANLINQIIQAAADYGLDGINIDFETITEDQTPAYLQFLRELSVQTHDLGLILSTDNYVPAYTWHYDREEQAKIVDYIIIMGYDEHTETSNEPGSVASLPFVKEAIEHTLTEVPNEQVILGVPFYTRSWMQNIGSDYFETEALAMPTAEEFCSKNGIDLFWNEELGQHVGFAEDGGVRYSIWMEDKKSLGKKLELADTYGLSGAAGWRLGLENDDIWEVWNQYLKE